MSELLETLAEAARRHGPGEAARALVAWLANRVAAVEIHRVRLQELAPWPREATRDPRLEIRLLAPAEVRSFAADPANDITPAFAERAEHGQLCFGALLDGRLIGYIWYALGSIEPEHTIGVRLSFPADVAFAYKAYTRSEHRGLHLRRHFRPVVMEALLARGMRRRLSLIEWTNRASLQASVRSGWHELGLLVTSGHGPRRVLLSPAAEGIRFGDGAP
jgi:hypothetical protein